MRRKSFKGAFGFLVLLASVITLLAPTDLYANRYRSIATGNWNVTTTWQQSINGGAWVAATGVPGAAGDTVQINIAFTVTTTAAVTTVDSLTVAGSLSIGGFAITVSGNTSVSGTVTVTSVTAAKIFNNLVINAGGTWTNSGNSTITINGSLQNDGTFTSGTGVYTLAGAAKTISGANAFTFGSAAITGTYTNNDTLTVSTALTGAGGLTNGSGAQLKIGGTSTITTLTATASNNEVNYTGAAQTVHVNNYWHLTLSGSAAKTLNAAITTISGNLTLSGTATTTGLVGLTIGGTVTLGTGTTFTSGAFTHSVAGDWTNNGGTFTPGTGVVNFNGAGAQAINGTPVTQTFGAFTVNKTAGTLSIGGSTTALAINGTVTLTAGTFSPGSAHINLSGNWTNNGGTFAPGTSSVRFITGAARTIGGTAQTTFGGLNVTAGTAVTANINTTADSLNFDISATATSLTLGSAAVTLTVNNGLAISQPTAAVITAFNVNAGTANISGTTNIGGTVATAAQIARIAVTTGALTFNGPVTYAANTVAATEVISVTGAGSITFGQPLTLSSGTVTNLTSAGTINFNGGLTFGGANAPALTTIAASNVTFGNNLTAATTVLTLNATSNAIFTGTAAITPTAAITFGNFQLNAGSAVTLAGDVTVAGNWTNNGGTLSSGANSVRFTGAAKTIGGSAASMTFGGLNIAAGATVTANISTTADSLNFDVSGTATSLTLGSAAVTLTVNNGMRISQPGAAVATALNVNAGIANISGTTNIGGTVATATQIARIAVTTGALTFNGPVTYAANTVAATEVISVTGAGSITFGQSLALSSGTVTNITPAGTINFNGGLTFGAANAPVLTTIAGTNVNFGNNLTAATTVLTLNATSNAVFTGTATITPTSAITFGNFQLNNGVAVTLAGDINVAGNWTDNGGTLSSGTNAVRFTGAAKTIGGSAASTTFGGLNIAAAATVTANINTTVDSLTLDLAAAATSLTLGSSAVTLTVNNGLTVRQPNAAATTALNVNAGTANISGTTAVGGAVATATRISQIAVTTGSLTFNGPVNYTSNTVAATEVITVTNNGSITFTQLQTLSSGTISNATTAGTINFNGGLTFGGANTPALATIAGTNVNFGNNLTAATTALTLNAASNAAFTGTATITPTSAITFGNLQVNPGASNTVSLAGNVSVVGNLTVSSGSYDINTFTSNRSAAGGTLSISNGGTLLVAGSSGGLAGSNFPSNFSTNTLSGLVNFDGTVAQTVPALSFTDLTISSARIANSVTLAAGTINIAGNFNNSASFTSGAFITTGNTVVFSGTTAQSISGTATTVTFNNMTVNNTSAAVSVASSVTTLTLGGTMVLSSGSTLTAGTAAAINVSGDWTNNGGTFNPGSSTVAFVSTAGAQAINGTAGTQTFGNVSVAKSAQTLTLAGSTTTLNLNGSVTLTSGIFNAGTNSPTINVTGDWTNNGGTFTSTGSAVRFNGSGVQNINGTAVTQGFNKMIVDKSTGALSVAGNTTTITLSDSLRMAAGTFNSPNTLTITGGVTLNGGTWNGGSVTSIAGNWVNNSGVSAFNAGTGYVDLTGTSDVSIDGTQSTTFDTLRVSKNALGTLVTLAQPITIGGNLSIVTGTVADSGKQITGNVTGSVWVYSTGALSIGSVSTATVFPTLFITANTHLNAGSTVTFVSGQNQTVSGVPTYGVLSLAGGGTKTLNQALNLLGGLNIAANVTLDDAGFQINGTAGKPMTMAANSALILGSTSSATSFPTNFTSSDITLTSPSAVIYNSNQPQTISSTPTYRTLSLVSSAIVTKTASGPITIDNLTIGTNNTIDGGSNVITANGNVTNNGEYIGSGSAKIKLIGAVEHMLAGSGTYYKLQLNNTSNGATLTGSPTISDSLVLTAGNFTVGANTLTLNGPKLDSLETKLIATGSSSFRFGGSQDTLFLPKSIAAVNNLNVDMHTTDSKLNHAAALTINGALTLTLGSLDLFWYPNPPSAVDTLTIPNGGSISIINGRVKAALKMWIPTGSPTVSIPVGGADVKTQADLVFTGVTTAGWLTTRMFASDHPQINTSGINPSKSINRYWMMRNNGIAFTSFNITLNYAGTSDMDGGANPSNFVISRYNPNTVNWTSSTTGTRTATSTQATGITAFGDFQVGEPGDKLWTGGGDGTSWGDANNWNPVGIPSSLDVVKIRTAANISITTAAVASSVVLNNSSATLTISSGSLTISSDLTDSTGTLNTQVAFPTVSGTVSLPGGTVGYTAAGAQNVSAQSYYTLALSGSGAKTFSGTTNIANNFTIGGTATATTTGTTIVFNGTGAQAVAATTYNNLTINGTGPMSLASGTTTVGGMLTLTAGTLDVNTQTVTLNGSVTQTSGALSSQSTGTVNYNQGSAGQSVLAANYGNLTFSNFNKTLASSGTIGVAGTFTPGSASGHTVTGSTIDFNANGAQTIAGFTYNNLSLSTSGLKTFATATSKIADTFAINGPATASASASGTTIEYNGSSAQAIQPLTYYNLTIDNAAGTTIAADVTVNNTLTLSASGCTITTGANKVIMAAGAAVARTAGHVIGNLEKNFATGSSVAKTFEIGTGASYSPADISFASVTSSGNLIVTSTTGEHPQVTSSTIDATKDVHRYWTLTNSGIAFSGAGYSATLTFINPGDLDAGVNTNNFIVGAYNSGWTYPTVGTKTSTTTQITGQTSFGDFAIGEFSGAVTKIWAGPSSGNWNNATNWSPNGVPTSGYNVNLSGADTISIDIAAVCNTLTMNNSSLVLSVASGQSLSASGDFTLTSGTLDLLNSGSAFPTVAGTKTLSGGTVNYSATAAQNVSTLSYFGLHLAGSGTKTFAGTTNIAGDFTIGGTAAATTTGTTIVFNGSAAQAIAATTYENLTINGSGTKTLATGTTTVNSTLALTAGTLDVSTRTLVLNSTVTQSSGSLTSQPTGTVQYNQGSNGQSVIVTGSYGNLTFGNFSKTLASSGTIGISGTFTTGSGTGHTITGSTIDFNGTGAQTVPAFSYNNLTISGTRTTNSVTLSGTINVAGDFTNSASFSSGGFITSGSAVNFNATSGSQAVAAINYNDLTFSNAGATRVLASGATTGIGGTLSAAGAVTVTGSTVDFNGGSQSVPGLAYDNLTMSGSSTKTLSSTTTINGNFTVSGVSVDANGGTVTFNNSSGSQSVAATTYNNLTFSGNSAKTLASGATSYVSGNFSVSGGAVTSTGSTVEFNKSSGSQTLASINYNNLTFSNGGQRVFSSGTTGIAGALTLNAGTADVSTNSSLIEYNGSSAQTIASMTYWQLKTNNASGFNLSGGDVTVNSALTLQSGIITTGANKVIITFTSPISRTSGHIFGNLKYFVDNIATPNRIFTIGDASNYTPVTVQFPNVTSTGYLTATTASGDHSQIGTSNIDGAKSVNRTWTLTNSGVVFDPSGYSATFTFINPGDLDGGANTNNFIVGMYNAGWTYPTVGTKTGTTTQTTGQTTFSDFQLGEPSGFVPKTWDGGASTSNWGDAANWNPDGVPTSSNNVTLSSGSPLSITVNVAGVSNDLTINSSNVTLTIASGQSLSSSGNFTMSAGTLNTNNAFPSVTGTVSILGGTIGYTASGAQSVSTQSYSTLSLSGSGAKTFSGTTNIAGDFTIGGTATATTTGTTIVFNGSGAQAVAAMTYNNLTINGSGTKTLASGTTTVGGTLTLTTGTVDVATNSLTLNGTVSQTSGVLTSQASGTVTYNQGSGGQSVLAGTYGNLTFSAFSKTLASSGTIAVAGTFTPAGSGHTITGSTINFNGASGSQTIPVFSYHHLALSNASTKTLASGTINVAGDFTVSGGAVTVTGSTLNFDGGSGQNASGFTYNNLTLNNSTGLTISGNTTVNAALTLASGSITTGSNTVILPAAGVLTRAGGGFVIGNLQKNVATGSNISRFFEVGAGSTFAPVNITFASVTSAGNIIVTTAAGEHPQIATSGLDQSKDVNRYWTITNSGTVFSGAGYTARLSFVASSDKDAGATAPNFNVRRYSSGWNSTSVGTRWSDSTEVLTEVNFGDFAVGELSAGATSTWDGGASTNNWGDANNWNPNGVPTSSTNVDLSGANTIDINVAAACNSITLNNGGLTLTVKSGNSLTVSGNLTLQSGTLNTETSFPSVTGTISMTGGTVGYAASGSQSISAQSYFNLSLSGSGTKTFPSGTTFVASNFSVSGGTVDASANASTINFNGSGAQSIAATTYYNLSLSAAGTKTFASGTSSISNTFSVSGGATPNATSFTTTIDYSGASQGVVAMDYSTLRIGGSGTKTLASGVTTIAADLNVAAGTLDIGTNAANRTASGGTLTVASGATLKLAGSSGGLPGSNYPSNFSTNTLSGAVEFNGSGSQTIPALGFANLVSSSSGARVLASSGTIGVAGLFTVGGNSYTVSGSTMDFNGSGNQSVPSFAYNNLSFSTSGTKTIAAGTTSVAGVFAINGSATSDATTNATTFVYNGSGNQTVANIAYTNLTFNTGGTKTFAAGTTNIAGTFTITGPASADATTNSTTISYNGAGAQTVVSLAYSNLGLTTSGTKTIAAGTTSILGNFTIGGAAAADATTNSTTVIYNGSGAQSVAAITYNNVTVSTGGTKTLAGSATVAGNLTISAGTLDLATYTADRTAAGGTLTLSNGASLRIGGTNTLPANFSTHSVGSTSTIEYYGSAQSIATLNSSQHYGNLTLSGSSTKTATGNLIVDGAFSNSVTTAMSTFTLSLNAGETNSGTIQFAGATNGTVFSDGTVEYNGSVPQTVTAGTYNILVFSNSGVKTVTASTTANGNLTINSTASVTVNPSVVLHVGGDFSPAGTITNNGTVSIGN